MRKFLLSFALLIAGAMTVGAQVAIPTTGVYTIEGGTTDEHRGFLAAGENITSHPVLAEIAWTTYKNNSTTAIDGGKGKNWYVRAAAEEGKFYIYNLALKKFIAAGTGTQINFSDTPYLWTIVVNGSNNNYNSIRDTNATTYLCFACGKNGANRPVHFNNQESDGGSMHTFTTVENGTTTFANEIAAVEKILSNVGEISYTLTDAAGNVFEGTYEGIRGKDLPQLTGAHGYSLNDVEWNNDGDVLTATITFPVTVSSAEHTDAVLLNIINEQKFIRAVGTNVKVQTTGVSPLDMGAFWAIYPALENGEFTFTIKNLSTEMYIYTEATSGKHNTEGTVILNKTATKLAIVTENDFKVDGKTLYLSINSSGDTNVWLGVHGNEHTGTNISTKAPSTETITLADDQPYAWPIEVGGEFDVQYTRTLIAGIWNPIYLPFEAGLNLNDYDVAEFTSAEGNTVVLTKLTADNEAAGDVCLEPNKAYVVRAKRDEVLTLDLGVGGAISSNVEVEQELGEDFSVRGNYAVLTGADLEATDRVVGSNGNWGKLKSASTLKPYRLILSVPENFDASQALTMRVLDETTGVEEIIVDRDQQAVIFDLMGRRVETITEGGIYIVNGKKVVR